jgi:hypothetical protein
MVSATLVACLGSRGATAEVRGASYSVGSADDVHLDDVVMSPYAALDRIDIGSDWLTDRTAYAIPGIDPAHVLVVKLRSDLSGPNTPQTPFLVLLRGSDAILLLCPYMTPVGAKPSVDCDEGENGARVT